MIPIALFLLCPAFAHINASSNHDYPKLFPRYQSEASMIYGNQLAKNNFDLDTSITTWQGLQSIKQSKQGEYFIITMHREQIKFNSNSKRPSQNSIGSNYDENEYFYCVFQHDHKHFMCTDANEPATIMGEVSEQGQIDYTYIESGLNNNFKETPVSMGKFKLIPEKKS